MSDKDKKPPFEGKLIYKGVEGGNWVAGAPREDLTPEQWTEQGYADRGNFTVEGLVATGFYEIRPPRASATKKEDSADKDKDKDKDTIKTDTPSDKETKE